MENEKTEKTPNRNTTEKLGSGKILPLVFKLTIPAVIAQLITFLYNIVDRMYVAKIDESGMDALAALGIVLPITLIIQAFANLIGLGGAPRASMKLGAGDEKEAVKIFNTSFVLLLCIGLVVSLTVFFTAEKLVLLFGCPLSAAGLLLLTSKFILRAPYSYCLCKGSIRLSRRKDIRSQPCFPFS